MLSADFIKECGLPWSRRGLPSSRGSFHVLLIGLLVPFTSFRHSDRYEREIKNLNTPEIFAGKQIFCRRAAPEINAVLGLSTNRDLCLVQSCLSFYFRTLLLKWMGRSKEQRNSI